MTEELEELFNRAASFVQDQSISEDGKKVDQSKLLQLYGLYKSATIGPCNEPKPGIFNPKGRAKWDAWKQASSLSKEDAQESYIEKVKDFYEWIPEDVPKEPQKGSILGGNSVSAFANNETEEDQVANDRKNDPVFAWAKDNDTDKIKQWLIQGNDVNLKDQDGLTILHWVVDRGHVESCKILLDFGADPLSKDDDGQTPLDYAITCEHECLTSILEEYTKTRSLTVP